MKKNAFIIVSIILLIIGIVCNIFINEIVSLFIFSVVSAIITFRLYTDKNSIKEIADSNTKAISFILTFILLTVLLFAVTMIGKSKIHFKTKVKEENIPVSLVAISTYDSTESDLSYQTFRTKRKDTSVVIVKNNADMIIRNSNFFKLGGESSNCDYSNTYGLNASLLSKSKSSLKLYAASITSEENCSIPLFIDDSFVEVNDTKIESKSSYNASSIVVNSSGEIKANNITVLSKGKGSSALRVLGNSKANVINSLLEASSHNSPLIYNEGITELKNVTGTSNQDRFLVLKSGEISIKESTILTSGRGEDMDHNSAIKIIGDSTLNIDNSSININKNGLYYDVSSMMIIDDADTTININNSILNFGNNIFMNVSNSKVVVNLSNEEIKGNIVNDSSSVTLKLVNSKYEGDINDTILYLDSLSVVTLTKDTVLKELHNDVANNSNIILNGHSLKVLNN